MPFVVILTTEEIAIAPKLSFHDTPKQSLGVMGVPVRLGAMGMPVNLRAMGVPVSLRAMGVPVSLGAIVGT